LLLSTDTLDFYCYFHQILPTLISIHKKLGTINNGNNIFKKIIKKKSPLNECGLQPNKDVAPIIIVRRGHIIIN